MPRESHPSKGSGSSRRGLDRLTRALVVCAIMGAAITGPLIPVSNAQSLTPDVETTAIRIPAGTVFEIMGAGSGPLLQWSWVLTENREFIEAGRQPIFRVRLAKAGTYLLEAGIVSAQTLIAHARITIEVEPVAGTPLVIPEPPETPTVTAPEERIVETIPAQEENSLVLRPGLSVVLLTPTMKGRTIDLDTDVAIDSDNDGNPAEDTDNDGTFFRTDGTPLYLWMPKALNKRVMALRAVAPDGTAVEQRITVYGNESAIERHEIASEETPEGAMRFHVQFRGNERPSGPLLFQWSFGDGKGSLIEDPVHRYAIGGLQTVTVEIISLTNGTVLATLEKEITAPAPVVTPPPAEPTPEPEEPKEEPEAPPKTEGRSIFWTILIGMVVLLVAVGLGAGVFYVLGRFRKGGGLLQKKLEEIDSTVSIGPKDAKKIIDIPAAPMELKKKTETAGPPAEKPESRIQKPVTSDQRPATPPPPLAEKPKTPSVPDNVRAGNYQKPTAPTPTPTPIPPPPPKTETPKAAEAAAPAWLKKGLAAAAEKPATAGSPAEKPESPSTVLRTGSIQKPIVPTPTPTPPSPPAPPAAEKPEARNQPQVPSLQVEGRPATSDQRQVTPPAAEKPPALPAAPKPSAPATANQESRITNQGSVNQKPATPPPAAAAGPVPPWPQKTPTPAEKPKTNIPSPTPTPTPSPDPSNDEPIAFIRAESLEKENGKTDQKGDAPKK